MARLQRGEAVRRRSFSHHRVAILFETTAPQYATFTKMLAVGRASHEAVGGVYEVYEML